MTARARWLRAALPIAVIVLACVSTSIGSIATTPIDVGHAIAHRVGLAAAGPEDGVLWAVRFPRVVLAIVVGAALGVSGAAMQGIFRNPLVDPGLLGVSGGAALGAVVCFVFGARFIARLPPSLATYVVLLVAFSVALACAFAVERLGLRGGRATTASILLSGIAINALMEAVRGIGIVLANDAQLRTITFWSLGSLGGATWSVVLPLVPAVLLPTIFLARMGRSLNVLALGEREAGHLGVSVDAIKRRVLFLSAIAVGASVSLVGIIAFVGLVVPHVVRLAAGPDQRFVLPGSALAGAGLLLVADMIARRIASPQELPIGAVTACVGAPFFLYLLRRDQRRIA
ncbi:iron ABC transporter permease [soil metagenome]